MSSARKPHLSRLHPVSAGLTRTKACTCVQESAVEFARAELGGLDLSQQAAAPLHQPAVPGPVLHDLQAALSEPPCLLLNSVGRAMPHLRADFVASWEAGMLS